MLGVVLALDSSLVLAAIVGLWLVRVAPFVLQGTMPAAAGSMRGTPKPRTDGPGENTMMMRADQASAGPEQRAAGTRPEPASARPPSRQRLLAPRPGRLTVATVGAVALVAALVTLVLGLVGIVPLLAPLVCVAVTAASVAILRALAVRARRARVEQAFTHAMSPVQNVEPVERPTAPPEQSTGPQRATSLFDAEATSARPLTPMQLRTAALSSARPPESQESQQRQEPLDAPTELVPVIGAIPAGATAWAPVELPRPTYVDAAKVERRTPAPLDLPEAPRPSTNTPIKTSEAAARAESTGEDVDTMTGSTGPATGRINLDDVLQRRRA